MLDDIVEREQHVCPMFPAGGSHCGITRGPPT